MSEFKFIANSSNVNKEHAYDCMIMLVNTKKEE